MFCTPCQIEPIRSWSGESGDAIVSPLCVNDLRTNELDLEHQKRVEMYLKQHAYLLLALALGVNQFSNAQVITCLPCDMLGMSVNVGSQETMISIYHSGQYLTHPQEQNVFTWEFSDQQGNIVYQETIENQATISFGHNWPLTDTINVTVHFVNDEANLDNWYISEGMPPTGNSINCLFEDQLYWETGQPTPWGSWTFIHHHPGVDLNAATGVGTLLSDQRKLVKTVDAFGRLVNPIPRQMLFYIYNDGTVEKRFIVE